MDPNYSASEASLDHEASNNPEENFSKNIEKPSDLEQGKRGHTTLYDDKDSIQLEQCPKKLKVKLHVPNTLLNMPEELRKKIDEMRRSELTLLIQKSLFSSDLSQWLNRLSLPLNQMKNPDFLRQEESMLIKSHGLDVELIEPSLDVPRSSWVKVAEANGLEVDGGASLVLSS